MTAIRHTKVLIIGSGPAGYTAAVYAARAMLNPMLVQGMQPGGQLTITTEVENWPGDTHVQGPELMVKMEEHARAMGTEIISDHISSLDLSKRPFTAKGDSAAPPITADAVILATGAQAKWLGMPVRGKVQGLWRFRLRHLRWLFLSRERGRGDRRRQYRRGRGAVPHQFRHQGDADPPPRHMRAEKIMQDRLFKHPKIEVIWNSTIEEILGDPVGPVGVTRGSRTCTPGPRRPCPADRLLRRHRPRSGLRTGEGPAGTASRRLTSRSNPARPHIDRRHRSKPPAQRRQQILRLRHPTMAPTTLRSPSFMSAHESAQKLKAEAATCPPGI
jgi:thioredoxin reductase (NADPH)